MQLETSPSEAPLLTIAIPTYNRSRYLREFLEALLPQIESAGDVELLISDNASPDDTAQMLAEVLPAGGREIQRRYRLDLRTPCGGIGLQ